jgi:SAM-dependent methyltransferase
VSDAVLQSGHLAGMPPTLAPVPPAVDDADDILRAEAAQRRVAHRLVLPLLDRLGYRRGQAALLSAGCGGGADVDLYVVAGYDAWGVESSPAPGRWEARLARERLINADILNLPWPGGAFDLVVALRVLERVSPAQRLPVLRSLLRVTRPGGYVLLGGPNRRFPLTLFDARGARHLCLHSPWDRSLLSYGDQVRLAQATGVVDRVRPVPVYGLLPWNDPPPARPSLAQAIVAWLLGELPTAIYGSWLCFFTIALVHRAAADVGACAGGRTPHGAA